MPFRSEKQRRYLWENHPEIAERWEHEHGPEPEPEKKDRNQHFKDGTEDR